MVWYWNGRSILEFWSKYCPMSVAAEVSVTQGPAPGDNGSSSGRSGGRTLTPPHNSHLQNNRIMRKQISKTRIHYILWFIWETNANAGTVYATHVLLLVTSARKFKKLTAKGIFMFSGSAHQADRWLSIKTMHFLVFCIISVKIKRLSETPPWSFWKKTKTVVPLAASSFEPSAIILLPLVLSPPCLLSPISGSPCCWLCCHHPPPHNVPVTCGRSRDKG